MRLRKSHAKLLRRALFLAHVRRVALHRALRCGELRRAPRLPVEPARFSCRLLPTPSRARRSATPCTCPTPFLFSRAAWAHCLAPRPTLRHATTCLASCPRDSALRTPPPAHAQPRAPATPRAARTRAIFAPLAALRSPSPAPVGRALHVKRKHRATLSLHERNTPATYSASPRPKVPGSPGRDTFKRHLATSCLSCVAEPLLRR